MRERGGVITKKVGIKEHPFNFFLLVTNEYILCVDDSVEYSTVE